MALINCPECNSEVSDRASSCIKCGYPLVVKEITIVSAEIPDEIVTETPKTDSPAPPVPPQTHHQQPQTGYQSQQGGHTVIVHPEAKPSNGVGTAGFVLALIGLFLSWVPVLGWIVWFLGLILSFVGLFKSPKGLAIAGFIISIIGLIVLITIVGAAASMFSLM